MTIAPDRKALVTGGAAGFGLEVARDLRAAGARVAVLDVNQERLDAAAAELGEGALALQVDVRSPQQVRAAVARVASEFGGLDTVVNSAGVIHLKPLDEVTEEDWDLTLDVNLKGMFLVCQAAAPLLHLRRRLVHDGRRARPRRRRPPRVHPGRLRKERHDAIHRT